MHPILNIAILAARKAGNLITKYYETPNNIKVSRKNNNSFITNVNIEAEQLIVNIIRKYYPQHVIFGQEVGKLLGNNNNVQWIINPLDGIMNFINRLPHFAVSITVCIDKNTQVAVIYDPIRNELFTATRTQSAQLNGYRLRCSNNRDLNSTIIATSFPYMHKKYAALYITILNQLFIQCIDFRCTGSVALNLAYVAAGRINGLFEIGIKPDDVIGGSLLVRESGGVVTNFTVHHNNLLDDGILITNIVAGNPYVVKTMLSTIRTVLSTVLKL